MSSLACVSQSHVNRTKLLVRDAGSLAKSGADGAAADVSGPRVVGRKLVAGEVPSGTTEIRIVKLLEIAPRSAVFSSFFVVEATCSATSASF